MNGYKQINEHITAGEYLSLLEMMRLTPHHATFLRMTKDCGERMGAAPGSSHNHQAWEGGYADHIRETMNIACQLYRLFNELRGLPFLLADALTVLFLHDIEKPFKDGHALIYKGEHAVSATKENRKVLRARIIAEYEIKLTSEQENALRYVEGVPDSEYTSGERTMGELAAFCHCCDILSARLWHDRGREQVW